MSTTVLTDIFCPFEIEASWRQVLGEVLYEPYMVQLAAFVARDRLGSLPIYPPEELVFNAFRKTPYDKVKVVIVGQDPYHNPGQAHGLAFSVPHGVLPPPSLQNIFKELQADLGIEPPSHGNLSSWAEQGVLLLNATLTVKQNEPLSHHGKGWEKFTDGVIEALKRREDPVIFVLWGKSAQKKCQNLDGSHIVLTAAHPSPLSAHNGFFGCRHFSKINDLLLSQKKTPIIWEL